jgi:hypothetical protein
MPSVMYCTGMLVCATSRHFVDVPGKHCNANRTYLSPSLGSIPCFIRLGQSLRRCYNSGRRTVHLLNALKYSVAAVEQFAYFTWRMRGMLPVFVSIWTRLSLKTGTSYSLAFFVSWSVLNSVYGLVWVRISPFELCDSPRLC